MGVQVEPWVDGERIRRAGISTPQATSTGRFARVTRTRHCSARWIRLGDTHLVFIGD